MSSREQEFAASLKGHLDRSAEELRPVTILAEAANVVAVPANSPYRTFADLLADARAHPDKVTS